MLETVYLSLGTNIGNKLHNLSVARAELNKIPETKIVKISSVYETPPWGRIDQPNFFNQAVAVETSLIPLQLLKEIKNIEIKMGRQSRGRWGPREIDIDILLFGNFIVSTEQLTIPHPNLRNRLFVLVPLQEIEPDLVFPEDGASIEEVLSRVSPREKNQMRKR